MRSGRQLVRLCRLSASIASVAVAASCGGKDGMSPLAPAAVLKESGDGQSAAARQALPQPLAVRVVDAQGVGIAALRVAWVASYLRPYAYDTTMTDPDGVAREQLTLDTLAGSYTVTAAVGWLSPARFTATCTAGPAARLVWLVSPSQARQGLIITPPIQLGMRDPWNNVVTAQTVAVSIGITSGTGMPGATLSGTRVKSTVEGVATFDDLAIDKMSGGYTLTAQGGGMPAVTSAPFTNGPGMATGLAFVAIPYASGSEVGRPLVGVRVRIVDAVGGTVADRQDSITIALAPGVGVPGVTLDGTLTRRATAGVAVFDSLLLDTSGERVLVAVAAGLDSALSGPFFVAPGPAARLSFLDQPLGVGAGTVLAPIHVGVFDRFGNMTDSTASVSVAIATGTGTPGAVLSGTLVRLPIGGMVTFDDLSVDRAGTTYRLVAAATALTGATSDPFDIGP